MWMKKNGEIKKQISGKKRQIGTRTKTQIKKNRTTGHLSEVAFDIFPSYGIDDIGSCVDFLTDEGWWGGTKKSIKPRAEGFPVGSRETIIEAIESRRLLAPLRQEVAECWSSIDKALRPDRRNPYQLEESDAEG